LTTFFTFFILHLWPVFSAIHPGLLFAIFDRLRVRFHPRENRDPNFSQSGRRDPLRLDSEMIQNRMEGIGHDQQRKSIGKESHTERLKQKDDPQNHEHQNDLIHLSHPPCPLHANQDPTPLS
jgi:hypothetical protein